VCVFRESFVKQCGLNYISACSQSCQYGKHCFILSVSDYMNDAPVAWLTYYDCGLDRTGKYLTPLTGLLSSWSPENKIVTECLVKYEFLCSKLPFVYYAEQNKSWRNPLIASPLCSEVLITSCLKADAALYLGKLNNSCVKDKV